MKIKIARPGTQHFFLLVSIAIPCLLFLLFCFIKLESPFAWIPADATSPFMVKFFVFIILFLCFRPLYCLLKYHFWAQRCGIRIVKALEFTPSHLIVHYKDGTERFDYKALRLQLIVRITHIALGARNSCKPRVTLLTLRFNNASDGGFLFEVDHAVEYYTRTPWNSLYPYLDTSFRPTKNTKDLDSILTFANRFADFSYNFTYDCKTVGFVSSAPNSTFYTEEVASDDAKKYERVLSRQIDEALGKPYENQN